MKARDAVRVGTLRLALAALKNASIEAGGSLDEAGELLVLQREAKQRRESIAEYERGDRPELAEQERQELEILGEYLPAQLSEDEVRAIVAEAITACGASTPKDLGPVMKTVMSRVRGRADGKQVNRIVREQLSGE